jgi:putative membrane protein
MTRQLLMVVALVVVGVLGWAGPARAVEGQLIDDDFVLDALAAGSALVKAGDLAGQRGSTEEVRQLANRITRNQKRFNNALIILARDNKLAWERAVLRGEDAVKASVRAGLEGQDFDVAYLKSMIGSLERLIRLAEGEVGSGSEAVQTVAKRMLPVARESLQEASQAFKKSGGKR